MKLKITLSLFLIANIFAASAQPTLTFLTSAPTVGLKDTFYRDASFSSGIGGENQTWDFSAQVFSDVLPNGYEECNNVNNCADFPNTNLVENAEGSYVYFKVTPTALSNVGYAATGTYPFYFNDPEDFYRFPFTYGSSFIDTWGGYYTNNGVTYYRSGIDSVSADGWGTLMTPVGTFENTLRIKRNSTYRDSANIDGVPMLIDYKVKLYIWNDLAHKDFLYNTREVIQTVQGEAPTTRYFSTYVGGEKATAPNDVANILSSDKYDFNISPNPANDKVKITISLLTNSNVSISVTDVTGRIVYSSPANNQLFAGNNIVTLSIVNFPAGVYIVRILANNDVASAKLIISR